MVELNWVGNDGSSVFGSKTNCNDVRELQVGICVFMMSLLELRRCESCLVRFDPSLPFGQGHISTSMMQVYLRSRYRQVHC
jgi:hypothetical protein